MEVKQTIRIQVTFLDEIPSFVCLLSTPKLFFKTTANNKVTKRCIENESDDDQFSGEGEFILVIGIIFC